MLYTLFNSRVLRVESSARTPLKVSRSERAYVLCMCSTIMAKGKAPKKEVKKPATKKGKK